MSNLTPHGLVKTWREQAAAQSAAIEAAESPFEIWTAQEAARLLREHATALETALTSTEGEETP